MTITVPVKTSREGPRPERRATIEDLSSLQTGDRMTRAEFERRYEAHPEIKKAELVEGVVYVASPYEFKQHGDPHFLVAAWLGRYSAGTPGVTGSLESTVRLNDDNEPQPDASLRLDSEQGGTSRVDEDDYLEGPPELVVEIAASSASYDLGVKLRAYQRSGVREYLVVQVYERRVDWFILPDGIFTPSPPDEAGILKSEVFPGLWLQPDLIWTGDLAGILSTLQQGLASEEHTAFVSRLREARKD